jgi:heme exporter protein B
VNEPGFVAKTLLLTRKDLRIELRARDTLVPMLAFSFAVTLLLAFTLPTTGDNERAIAGASATTVADVLAGFFWVTILFAGLIGFARTFETEQTEGAIDALLLVPLDRSGLFLAKAFANLIFILLVEAFLLPLFVLLFTLDVGAGLAPLLLVILLVDIGFVAVGTLFASVAAQTSSRELILPVLALPALIPVFIAGADLTSDLIAGGTFGTLVEAGWFGVLIAFDVILGITAALVFEFVLE